ncbi:MAG TPA: response regulator [Kofleriaceae bacterium]|nr:response regulator [Kofleriaceae bacterium]
MHDEPTPSPAAPAATPVDAPARTRSAGAVAAPLVIVADDNPYMRWLVRATFRGRFEDIVEAGDGRELFWHLLRASRTRAESEVIVIADIRMPVCSGLDVLASFDELGYHPRTVVMTSYPDEQARASVAHVGGLLLPKPFSTEELRRVVEQLWRK